MFAKKTVDNVIASLTKMMDDLEALTNHHNAKADEHESEIIQAIAAKKAQLTEAARAAFIRSRIEGLMG
jgi:prefoldin subunit 5